MGHIDESTNSGKYVEEILNHTRERIKKNKTSENDRQDALLLEDFFNTLAGYELNNYNISRSWVADSGSQTEAEASRDLILDEIEILIQEKNPELNINDFLKNTNLSRKRNRVTGNAFEKYLDKVTKELAKAFDGELAMPAHVGNALVSLSYNLTGSDMPVVPIEYVINPDWIAREKQIKAAKKGKNNVKKYLEKEVCAATLDTFREAQGQSKIYYKQASGHTQESWNNWRSKSGISVKQKKSADIHKGWNDLVEGKTDTAIMLTVNHTCEISILDRILNLLKDATFSDKAYESTYEIRLGQTNSYRVYMATSEDAVPYLSIMKRIERWHRLCKCMEMADEGKDPHPSHNTGLYFYQLRYIYELTGVGQKYALSDISSQLGSEGAKFLIYHDSGHKNIKVLSTAAIAEDMVKMISDPASIGNGAHAISDIVKKDYALNATLKLRLGSKYTNGIQYGR